MDLFQLADSFCPGASNFLKELQENIDVGSLGSQMSTLAPGKIKVDLGEDRYSVKLGTIGFNSDEVKVVL